MTIEKIYISKECGGFLVPIKQLNNNVVFWDRLTSSWKIFSYENITSFKLSLCAKYTSEKSEHADSVNRINEDGLNG
jgi:hypothetical protein